MDLIVTGLPFFTGVRPAVLLVVSMEHGCKSMTYFLSLSNGLTCLAVHTRPISVVGG